MARPHPVPVAISTVAKRDQRLYLRWLRGFHHWCPVFELHPSPYPPGLNFDLPLPRTTFSNRKNHLRCAKSSVLSSCSVRTRKATAGPSATVGMTTFVYRESFIASAVVIRGIPPPMLGGGRHPLVFTGDGSRNLSVPFCPDAGWRVTASRSFFARSGDA
jgi:hypothetical protein